MVAHIAARDPRVRSKIRVSVACVSRGPLPSSWRLAISSATSKRLTSLLGAQHEVTAVSGTFVQLRCCFVRGGLPMADCV